MLLKFIKLCLIFIIIGGGFILLKQSSVRNQIFSHIPNISKFASGLPAVKGISDSKFGSISGQLKSEFDSSVNQAGKQLYNIKLGDVIKFLNRSQKIATDFRGFQEYLKEQVANFGKK